MRRWEKTRLKTGMRRQARKKRKRKNTTLDVLYKVPESRIQTIPEDRVDPAQDAYKKDSNHQTKPHVEAKATAASAVVAKAP